MHEIYIVSFFSTSQNQSVANHTVASYQLCDGSKLCLKQLICSSFNSAMMRLAESEACRLHFVTAVLQHNSWYCAAKKCSGLDHTGSGLTRLNLPHSACGKGFPTVSSTSQATGVAYPTLQLMLHFHVLQCCSQIALPRKNFREAIWCMTNDTGWQRNWTNEDWSALYIGIDYIDMHYHHYQAPWQRGDWTYILIEVTTHWLYSPSIPCGQHYWLLTLAGALTVSQVLLRSLSALNMLSSTGRIASSWSLWLFSIFTRAQGISARREFNRSSRF